jgi:hypothetical protein
MTPAMVGRAGAWVFYLPDGGVHTYKAKHHLTFYLTYPIGLEGLVGWE